MKYQRRKELPKLYGNYVNSRGKFKKPKLALRNFRLEIRRKFLTIIAARVWNSPAIRVLPGKKNKNP